MFTAILKTFKFPDTDLNKLIYYFERHIELDADDGPGHDERNFAELMLKNGLMLKKYRKWL
jgi:hypothetical protein